MVQFRKFKFPMGGGYFQFFTKNRPQKHLKHAILHTSQANWGLEPLRPPCLRYWLEEFVTWAENMRMEVKNVKQKRKERQNQEKLKAIVSK